jgi:hypothetical protein
MNARTGIVVAVLLAGCSQQVRLVQERTFEQAPEALEPPARACLVASAEPCLALDERPFTFCALGGTERCPSEGEFRYAKP